MKTIDVLGKPCPIPVVEAKKALAEQDTDSVLIKVDNIASVQNLKKMANGYGFGFSYIENAKDSYEVFIARDGKNITAQKSEGEKSRIFQKGTKSEEFGVVISSDTMGKGAEELGKILIKGFIYSLTELFVPPNFVIFLNSGAFLTSGGSGAIEDLKKLEQKGTEIFTCGACVNYYGLEDKPAVGTIIDMYGITERIASVGNVINI